MRRLWLHLSQAVTIGVAAVLVVALFYPEVLPWRRPPTTVMLGGTAAPPAARRDGLTSYKSAATAAMQSVVSVYTAKAPPRGPQGLPWFFGVPEQEDGNAGLGSGVVVSADGYILTNNHVVEGASEIAVMLPDGKPAKARLVGVDPETDLAVLKVDARDLRPIAFDYPGEVEIGDVVLAIGNPFGVGQTVTQGIVSATGRNRVGINTFENFVQTDAAINPGNSGGALVDASGRLIGINTAILSPSGGSLGIGFAIPVGLAIDVMKELVSSGRVARGWIGIQAQDLVPKPGGALGARPGGGAVVTGVLRGGPADRAGLKPGDVVVAVNGMRVEDLVSLVTAVAAIKPGARGELTVLRSGETVKLAVEAGRRPPLPRAG